MFASTSFLYFANVAVFNVESIIRKHCDRIAFAHIRNVKHFENGDFSEASHRDCDGDTGILDILKAEKPDMILIPGDLTESLEDEWQPERFHRPGLDLLTEAVKIAPVFYAFGNHESGACHRNLRHAKRLKEGRGKVHPSWKEVIRKTGVILVDEDWVTFRGFTVGGLGSGLLNPGRVPVYDWIETYAKQPGYKLLLCHHPEYFDRYLNYLEGGVNSSMMGAVKMYYQDGKDIYVCQFFDSDARFVIDGKEVILHAGDIGITGYGQGHGLENRSDEPVEMIALIVME